MDKMTVSSPAFAEGGLIPVRHTGFGEDLSPELLLEGLGEGVKSFALTLDDMSHPIPAFNHWIIWNLPVLSRLPEGIAPGARVEALEGAVQGCGYGKHRYRGPKPPFGWSHLYRFTVFGLDCLLDLPAASRKRHLLAAMEGHILQQGALTGHFR